MKAKETPLFSIIVPSRGRPDVLRRLLDSFKATTAQLSSLEVIIVVDSDDNSTINFTYDGFPFKRVAVEPGLTMGALNMAGYKASTGQYVMLLNDDVIVRTQAWDEEVLAAFKTYADGILLVHVNDRIFEEKLCIFPFLSRRYCELAGGICPSDYLRYRIDDHIYNVFNLLAVMGKIRILYLPEIVFEHTNFVLNSNNGVEYRPDERIHETDTKRFHELLPERKRLALRLMDHIDRHCNADQCRIRQNLLDQVTDSVALRRPEYIRVWSDSGSLSIDKTRVTIGVVTANMRTDHARTCVELIKKHTNNFDLIILDNNLRSTFNHPHEINKLLSICDTDYLVLMDDDVFVEAGWLDGMLRCLTPSVGVVTPLHKDRDGKLSYAGVVMRPDYSGHHTHSFAAPEFPTRIQTLCSAVVLIDMPKCGHLRFDESYSKYFLDLDYGFQVWLAGYEVVCSPYSAVTHLGGATLQQGSALSKDLFEIQRQHFVREWIETGRYLQLEHGIWSKVPEILGLLRITREVEALITQPGEDRELFRARAVTLFRSIRNQPALAHWAAQRIWDVVGNNPPAVDNPQLGHLGFLLGCIPHPVLIEPDFDGLNIILYNADYYALPLTEGAFNYGRVLQGDYSRYYQAECVDILKARIGGDIREAAVGALVSEPPPGDPILAEEYNDSRSYRAGSVDDLKSQISAARGSWPSTVKSMVKKMVKKMIISVLGIDSFLRIKDFYLQIRKGKNSSGKWINAAALKGVCKQILKDTNGSIVSVNRTRPKTAEGWNASSPAFKSSKVTLLPAGLDQVSTYKLVKATLFENQLQPWRSIKKTAGEINPIPSMITPDESQFLYYLARDHYRGAGAIVDLGPLAGGSTYALASGLEENRIAANRDRQIVSYDLWEFNEGWSDLFPGRHLRHGDDIEPIFLENLKRFRNLIESHKGDISNQKWTGGPIEILFIDAAKSPKVMAHVANEFFPYLIPNCSYVVHQDYVSAATPWINVAVQCLNDYFEYMDSPDGGTVCVQTTTNIPKGLLTEEFFAALPVSKARQLLADAREILMYWYKLCVWLGEANYLITCGLVEEAAEILNQVRTDPKFHPAVQFDVDLVNQALVVMRQGIRTSSVKVLNDPDVAKKLLDTSGKNRPVAAEIGDPQRWLNASPVTLVETDYQGHSIYRFEYKYFAINRVVGSFNYEDFIQAKYDPCLIGHSLSEARTAIDQLLSSKQPRHLSRRLVFARLAPVQLKPLLELTYYPGSTTLLVGKSAKNDWGDYDTIMVDHETISDWAHRQNSSAADLLSQRLFNEKFDRIVVPWSFPDTWGDNSLEVAASKLSNSVEVLHASGEPRLYAGENLHRLIYNKAYLASMFQVVPSVEGQTVLEAGCSDGLVADIVALCGASKVVGIDIMETVGCGFRCDHRIDYRVMDAACMDFSDQTFDLVYSIATFEHLPNPYQALLEMLRVTKIGGHGYVQAGPLYHSPFGHHMFEYFQEYPWIHLRKSKDGIIAYAKDRGIDKAIERDLGISCEQYVAGMLNRDHVNGLLLKDYRLDEFRERVDIDVLKFNISYEGRELLTREIAGEIPDLGSERLLEHGFEIAFRRIR